MARRKNQMAVLKRQREQRKAEKKEEKRRRRLARREEAAASENTENEPSMIAACRSAISALVSSDTAGPKEASSTMPSAMFP